MSRISIPTPRLTTTFAPETANPENRTVEMVFYSGATVPRFSWSRGEYRLKMSTEAAHVRMDRLNSGRAPMLDSHSDWSMDDVLGVIESGWIENGIGKARVRFAKQDERADRAWNKVQQGILRNVSMGVAVHKMKETSPENAKIKEYLAVDWEPMEISLVPIGADPAAHLQLSETRQTQEVEVVSVLMPEHLRAHSSFRGREVEILRLR